MLGKSGASRLSGSHVLERLDERGLTKGNLSVVVVVVLVAAAAAAVLRKNAQNSFLCSNFKAIRCCCTSIFLFPQKDKQ